MIQALTANDLLTGEPVFGSPKGWAPRWADALLFDAPEPAAAALELAKAQSTIVVDPYLVDCVPEGDVAVPVSYRERLRALGPTIHPDMGKQAEGGAVVHALQAAHGAGRSTGRLSLIARKK